MITVLPDHIANQIAAGEVIQRPASAVKELLENAVDASATFIQLIINDAGKSLVQVVDNGRGMNEADARLCFGRHATSKISCIEDLFRIQTMGFRGEALASIAAVAQVELRTRTAASETGFYIEVENSQLVKAEPIAAPQGTSVAMKNLFFNVPARRNFLKSNAAEMRHIIDEFTRVALAFPAIAFSLHANNQQLFQLESGTLKQRIVQLMGASYESRLVTVKEETDYLNIRGFVGKPDAARKTRGEQYFFVNNRFIRSGYLHHAVMSAFQGMLAPDHFPLYVLFIDLDPQQIDINVHPTKQEIKFEDEKIVYAFVQAAVKHALAQFSITPTLDFELDASIQQLSSIQQPFTEENKSRATDSSLFKSFTQKNQAHLIQPTGFRPYPTDWSAAEPAAIPSAQLLGHPTDKEEIFVMGLHNTYIIYQTTEGFWLIDQQGAHERILYEQLQQSSTEKPIAAQRTMFPITLSLPPADAALLNELSPSLVALGFVLEASRTGEFIIQATPSDSGAGAEKSIIESLLEEYKHFNADAGYSMREKLIRSLAKNRRIKSGTSLSEKEMQELVVQLLACQQPGQTPDGKPTYLSFSGSYLSSLFGR
ncbi:MAG: DNA mismatch repair endonuclease MutL [Chitinophagia bacterium]|nr:DNA mismatch repair endonuclease MutL [Chitinophagia bacterium]